MPTEDEKIDILRLYIIVEVTPEHSGGRLCRLYSTTGGKQGASIPIEALYNDLYFSMLARVDVIESEQYA